MNIGFIGTGSMGSMLIEAFVQSNALLPEEIIASNRTAGKVQRLAEAYPGLRVAGSNLEVAETSELFFLCIKPTEYKAVIDEIRPVTRPEQIAVSIASPVLIRHLEGVLNCRIAKIIPSITNLVHSGASLCIWGERLSPEDRQMLDSLMSRISTPVYLSEAFTRVSSDISSCGPAFLAYFLQKFIDAAVEETGLPREQAIRLAAEMTLGTGLLLTSGAFTPEELRRRVAVPGGITAEGLRLMESELGAMFPNLIRLTHAKYREELEKAEARLAGPPKDEQKP